MPRIENVYNFDDNPEEADFSKKFFPAEADDHFVEKKIKFAGTHVILDFWGASQLDNPELMEAAIRKAVVVADATLLHYHIHQFTPSGGLSGVAVLAESHISVHTWPERNFAAFDIFMCGDAKPMKAARIIKEAFLPTSIVVHELFRGRIEELL